MIPFISKNTPQITLPRRASQKQPSTMDFLTIVLGLLFSYTLIQSLLSLSGYRKNKNLPPGPVALPLIGHLHLLGDQPHQSLAKLAKTYGPIMFLKFGSKKTLVITSSAAAREVLQKQDLAFSSRNIPNAVHALDQWKFSVSWLPVGTKWRTLRKILNNNIFSGSRLDANQHLRSHKVKELIAYCKKSCESGESVDIGRAAFRSALNILSNTIFSKDFADPNQDSAKEMKELIGNIMQEVGKPNLVDFYPVLAKADPQRIRTRLTVHYTKIMALFDGLINERLETRKMKQHKDILETCLNISEENPDEIDRPHMKTMFLDLIGAGTDSTSSTVEWAMSELLRNPETMAKAKEELEQVIGKGKIVEEDDVARLPYLLCVIKETLRLHPPVPFLVPRQLDSDVEIFGYTVPKGTQVFVNAWAIGRDPSLWEDASEFKPERFLNTERDIRGQDFEVIPFGAGRRKCPALPLALRTNPVMVGSLLNNFNWKLDGGIKPKELDMTENFGITLRKDQHLHAIPMPLTA